MSYSIGAVAPSHRKNAIKTINLLLKYSSYEELTEQTPPLGRVFTLHSAFSDLGTVTVEMLLESSETPERTKKSILSKLKYRIDFNRPLIEIFKYSDKGVSKYTAELLDSGLTQKQYETLYNLIKSLWSAYCSAMEEFEEELVVTDRKSKNPSIRIPLQLLREGELDSLAELLDVNYNGEDINDSYEPDRRVEIMENYSVVENIDTDELMVEINPNKRIRDSLFTDECMNSLNLIASDILNVSSNEKKMDWQYNEYFVTFENVLKGASDIILNDYWYYNYDKHSMCINGFMSGLAVMWDNEHKELRFFKIKVKPVEGVNTVVSNEEIIEFSGAIIATFLPLISKLANKVFKSLYSRYEYTMMYEGKTDTLGWSFEDGIDFKFLEGDLATREMFLIDRLLFSLSSEPKKLGNKIVKEIYTGRTEEESHLKLHSVIDKAVSSLTY